MARPGRILTALLLGLTALKCACLFYPDLNLTYPYIFPASFDLIESGLALAGHDLRLGGGPPGIPIIIALLSAFDLQTILPHLNQLLLALLTGLLFSFWRARFDPWTALVGCLLLYFNYFLQDFSFYIMADLWAMAPMTASLIAFTRARDDRRRYFQAMALLGVSTWFHHAAVVTLLPVMALVLVLWRRDHLRDRSFHLAAAAGAAILLAAPLLTWVVGAPRAGLFSQISLHLDSMTFYLLAATSVIGLPGLALFVAGLIVWSRRRPRRQADVTLLLLLGANLVYWALLFRWNDRRFIIYSLVPLFHFMLPAVARLLAAVRSGPALDRLSASLLLVLALFYSHIRYPDPLRADRLALTPVHFLVAASRVEEDGRLMIDLSSIDLVRIQTRMTRFFSIADVVGHRLAAGKKTAPRQQLVELTAVRNILDHRPTSHGPVSYFSAESRPLFAATRRRFGNTIRRPLSRRPELSRVPAGAPVLIKLPSPARGSPRRTLFRGRHFILMDGQ